jgi:hypothetical protein
MEDVEFVDTSVRPFIIRTSEREVTSRSAPAYTSVTPLVVP